MGKAGEKAAKTPNRLLPDFKRLGAALQCAHIAARKDAEIVLAPFSAQGRFRRSQELGREWFMCAYERKRYGCSEASLLVSKCASQ